MSAGELFWDVVPYVVLAIVVVGIWWRYRYDKFGWTTRSSQLYESRLLRIGSPLFHFGILVVIVGHVIIALILFALWPFTRLVHVFSAPIAYLFRPYIVYRSRDVADRGQLVGSRPARRGW